MTKCPFCKGTGKLPDSTLVMPDPCAFCGEPIFAREYPTADAEGTLSKESKIVTFYCINCGIRAQITTSSQHKPEEFSWMYRGIPDREKYRKIMKEKWNIEVK